MTGPQPATRRRGKELEQAIQAAVLGELDARRYSGLTFEGVAARAGTSKPVLYRRWSTKAEMVLAAIGATVSERHPVDTPADTGGLGTDIVSTLTSIRAVITPADRRMLVSLLADLDPQDSKPLNTLLFAQVSRFAAPLVHRARERGELGPRELSTAILNAPFDLARHDMLVRGDLTDERIAVIAHEVAVPLWTLHSGVGS